MEMKATCLDSWFSPQTLSTVLCSRDSKWIKNLVQAYLELQVLWSVLAAASKLYGDVWEMVQAAATGVFEKLLVWLRICFKSNKLLKFW